MRQHRGYAPSASESKQGRDYFSNAAFAFSLITGLLLALALTRLHGPLQRENAAPWQLADGARNHFMVAIALEYGESGDLAKALNKLIALRPAHDPMQVLADGACELGSSGYLGSDSGIAALRQAAQLYGVYGRESCAEQLLPLEITEIAPQAELARDEQATPAAPLPTKTPLPEIAQVSSSRRILPTQPTLRRFEARVARSFCDVTRPAIIEVQVVDYLGRGIPGQGIRVRWGAEESIFFSGLKREHGDAYADFQMDEGIEYAIDIPGTSSGLDARLNTGSCFDGNRQSLKSWRITFVEI